MALLVTLVAACGGPAPPTETKTVTVSTTSAQAAPGEGPHSTIARITLPPGSLPTGGDPVPGIELWAVPTNYDYTVEFIKRQLPTGRDYDGLKWCAQDINSKLGYTQWTWGTEQDMLDVFVDRSGSVTIMRGESPGGCY